VKQERRVALHTRALSLSVGLSDLYVPTVATIANQKLGFIPSFASLGLGKQFCQGDSTDSKQLENT